MSKETQKLWERNHVPGLIDNIDAELSQIQRAAESFKFPSKTRKKINRCCTMLIDISMDVRSWAITAKEKSDQLNEGRNNGN